MSPEDLKTMTARSATACSDDEDRKRYGVYLSADASLPSSFCFLFFFCLFASCVSAFSFSFFFFLSFMGSGSGDLGMGSSGILDGMGSG